jgi:hypothetical protein
MLYFFKCPASSSMHCMHSMIMLLMWCTYPFGCSVYGIFISFKIQFNFKYYRNSHEVESPSFSLPNSSTCYPEYFSFSVFQSVGFSMASNWHLIIYSSACLVILLRIRTVCHSSPMAVSSGPYLSGCTCCTGSVALDVVCRVKGSLVNFH